jgi:hypothetical protein
MAPAIVLYLIAALTVGYLGRNRRIGMLGFVILSVLFTPLLILLILFLTAPKRDLRQTTRRAT